MLIVSLSFFKRTLCLQT